MQNNAIVNLRKRQNEEKLLIAEMEKKRSDRPAVQLLTKKLKSSLTSQEMVKKRIDFLVKGTNFTMKMLEDEIHDEKFQNKGKICS